MPQNFPERKQKHCYEEAAFCRLHRKVIGGAGGTFLLPIVMENFGTVAALSGCVAALLLGGVVCQLWAPETGKKRVGQAAARA